MWGVTVCFILGTSYSFPYYLPLAALFWHNKYCHTSYATLLYLAFLPRKWFTVSSEELKYDADHPIWKSPDVEHWRPNLSSQLKVFVLYVSVETMGYIVYRTFTKT